MQAMPCGELRWRVLSKTQDVMDRCLYSTRRQPVALTQIANVVGDDEFCVRKGLAGGHFQNASPALDSSDTNPWRDELLVGADSILQNRLSFFDFRDYCLGTEINWNYEYKAKIASPMVFAPHIDYRNYRETGDCKFVWEPNRHQHLVVLARAYHLTGQEKYAKEVIKQIESWIQQCPFGTGMNWRSPLELAIRLINWVWAYELIAPSGVVTTSHQQLALPVIYRHLWEISRKYSRYSSANNHLVGEAAGVFIGSLYFHNLKHSKEWVSKSRSILNNEMARQVSPDGGHCELATSYHLFVLEFFLLAGMAARNIGEDFPSEYWGQLEKMFEFVAALAEGGEPIPMFGDNDDGYVVDFTNPENRVSNLLSVGAALFHRKDFELLSNGHNESVYWLLGPERYEKLQPLASCKSEESISSRALENSGYYLLQSGCRNDSNQMSLTFDCGQLGFGSIAAHGHADALSVTLRAFGYDILVDPGTYDYFTYPEWRNYFRSTRAHNTIVIDDQDQSEMLGSFLWGRRANAQSLQWNPTTNGGMVVGEHDGYNRLKDPVTHRRRISLSGSEEKVEIQDELFAHEQHNLDLCFHFSEFCTLTSVDHNRYQISCGERSIILTLDPNLIVTLYQGHEAPIFGWISRGYHLKVPCTTLVGRYAWCGNLSLQSLLVVE
jgi:hypothetical protein